MDIRYHNEILEAFRALHARWLTAEKRGDMNAEMDALARALGLDPLTLQPACDGEGEAQP